ncbi:MAG: serine--tRNA ligase, partial [Bdellovibrionales bacterium]|nr:serine--tRNA ligase [Bdellovibrionales bacterium]
MQKIASSVKKKMKRADDIKLELEEMLLTIPNLCHHSVPIGKDETENAVVREVGTPKKFGFVAKDHSELGEKLNVLDFERAGKVTGARFTFLKAAGAQLERAVAMFMVDTHVAEHGYTEIIPPYIVNSDSLRGTGQFPKFKEDVFHLEGTDYYLIPTSEVPVTNLFRDETLDEEQLPLQLTAFSPNFRSEAGSYGKDTKGLIRQHQFHKVELVHFVHPSKSEEAHEQLTGHAENILKKLELPYRVSALCTGDIGFAATKCYDLEVWLPGQSAYREISSCSNFWDFQARRANIRFKAAGTKNKPQYVHTLNGSGLAVGRTVVAIMENYQQEDGSIEVPEVLKPYMGGKSVIS